MTEFEKRLACVINADGTIARGYMIDRCEFDGVNKYTITWKIPLQGAAKTSSKFSEFKFSKTIGDPHPPQVRFRSDYHEADVILSSTPFSRGEPRLSCQA